MATKHFTIYDASGNILRTGQVPEELLNFQKQPDEFLLELESDPEKDLVDTVNMSIIKDGKPPPPIDMDYVKARVEAYPPIASQLDMLWHAMDTDQIPKAEPFYSTLKAVKLAYPSDNSVIPGSVNIMSAG